MRCTAAQRQFLALAIYATWQIQVVAFGGSRFGGKTFTGCLVVVLRALLFPGTKHLCLRQVLSAADANLGSQIKQLLESFGLRLGLRSRGFISFTDNKFTFPNGSVIQLGYGKRESDYEIHVGTQWDTIWIEQAEQFTKKFFDNLRGSNRKSKDTECVPIFLLTFNPGGRGSEWLQRHIVEEKTRDMHTVFVKSVIRECLATLEQDPNYILRSLNRISDPIRRAQWLEGDWDAKSGAYFRLEPKNLVVMTVPPWADWYGGVDWGRAAPFCYLQAAHWQEQGDKWGNPGRRHIHIAGEVYQRHLDLDIQAQRGLEQDAVLRRSNPFMHEIEIRYADPRVFDSIESESNDATRSKADVWAKHGFYVYPSLRYSRVARWELIRYLLRHGILTIDPEACPNGVSEFRNAIYKEGEEDLDQKKCMDHFLDALSYVICPIFGLDYSEEQPIMARHEQVLLRIA